MCTIATYIVHSKLDYFNSVYCNLPKSQISRLQQIQKSLARAIVKAPKSCHITLTLSSLAQNNRMHRIQTPLTHLQSPHNHQTSVSAQPYLCSTSLQHSLFISGYPRSTTNIVLATYNWSLLSVCLTLSLESISYSSLSINLTPVPLSLSCLFMPLPHLLTLSSHHSHHP